MKQQLRWKFVLPILQLALAISLWLYTPFQFSSDMLQVMHLSPEQAKGRYLGISAEIHTMYYPPLAGKILYVVNLPAHELSSQISAFIDQRVKTIALQFQLQSKTRGLPMIFTVGTREVLFVAGICALWFWIGNKIDDLIRGSHNPRETPRTLGAMELLLSFALSVFLIIACLRCLLAPNCAPPWRHVMTAGLIWPIVFFYFFCVSLRSAMRKWRRVDESSR